MKIGIISDIHGNMQALDAVLKDIKDENCESIFCLGDLAMAGPQPIEAINKIANLTNENKLFSLQGNTDEMIVKFTQADIEKLKEFNEVMGLALEDDKIIIPEKEKEFLAQLPSTKELEIEGIKILLTHGSPRKNNENIFPDLPLEKVEEIISSTDADIIFAGHTHIPCGYQTNTNQTVVNTGSIGRPFTANAQSCYAILEINPDKTFYVKHKFVKYDNQKAAELMRLRKFKNAYKIADMLINPTERYPK